MPLRLTALVANLALATLGLSACVSMEPAYKQPDLPVPNSYAQAATAQSGAQAAMLAWEDFSADAELNALVRQALANNRDLRAAVLRVEEARAAYGIQRADILPTISTALDASRTRLPADLSGRNKAYINEQYQLGVGLSSWELDLWGRIRSLNEAALQSYLSSDASQRAVRVSLVSQVANSYLGLRELDERLALAQRTTASRADSLRIFRRRVELGATSKFEMTQVEVLWRQAATLVTQLEQSRATQLHALNLLVGSTVQWPPAPKQDTKQATKQATKGLAHMPRFREVQVGLPSDLLLQRPDIVAAEHALRGANANIGAARAAFFPRIALTGAFGTASVDLDNLFQSGSSLWKFAPSISLPIFDGGRRSTSLDLAEVRRDQAVVRYEQAVQSAFRDVSDALSARRWLGEQLAVTRAMRDVQGERARLAKLRYDSGAVRYLDVLDAERDLMNVEQQLVQTQRAQLAAQVTLYAALGGGSLVATSSAPSPAPSSTPLPAADAAPAATVIANP